MIRNTTVILICLLLPGCNVLGWSPRHRQPATPPIPVEISINELVDHLNRQPGDLNSWQCADMAMKVYQPRRPSFNFKGSIVCEAPGRFHMSASGPFTTSLDLGSNEERCWVLIQPQQEGLGTISWRHKDAHLIQQNPDGIPYIDSDWLMVILGLKKLDAADFVLQTSRDPNDSTLKLESIGNTPGAGVDRYVITVDRNHRVIRKHEAYDAQGNLVVRAILRNHKSFDGHYLPQRIEFDFPGTGVGMALAFGQIDPNIDVDNVHWNVPTIAGRRDVDLGSLYASRQVPHQSAGLPDADRWSDGTPRVPNWSDDEFDETPKWDTQISHSRVTEAGYDDSAQVSRPMWHRVLDPWNLTGRRQ